MKHTLPETINAPCACVTHEVVERRGWTGGTTRGGVAHLGLTHTGMQQGRLWTKAGAWAAKTVKGPPQQPAQPQYANYWALTHKRHPPQPAQPRHTNHAETALAGAPPAAANKTQQLNTACEGKNG